MVRFTFIGVMLVVPGVASAHIHLTSPAARTEAQKRGPCGATNSPKGAVVATYEAGQTIQVVFDETIDHPSHYRVSIDFDGQDDFEDPAALDEYYSNDAVLVDGVPDKVGGDYVVDVTLPDVACDNCTLQLVQVMYDKAPPMCPGCIYGDNDLYYQCADIRIVAAGSDPEPLPEPEPIDPEPVGSEPIDPVEPAPNPDEAHDHDHDHGPSDPAGPTAQAANPNAEYDELFAEDSPDDFDVRSAGCQSTPSTFWGLVLTLLFTFGVSRRRRH